MRNRWMTSAVAVACATTLALAGLSGGEQATCGWVCGERGDKGLAALRERVSELIRYQTFMALPESHRETITERLGVENLPTIERGGEIVSPWAGLAPQPEEKYQKVADIVDRETFYGFEPIHQRMLVTIVEQIAEGEVPPGPCFKPGTDEKLIAAFQAAMAAGIQQNGDRFQQTTRWGATALDPTGTITQGEPTTLTYSYVPDGTFVPNLIGVSGNSDLQAWFNGIYGSPATWQALFDQVFAEWASLSGNTYVYEPNDDGVNLNQLAGSAGVRGDLRIAAIFIDGNSGVLAYNNFPQDGDMVLDSGDSFFNNTAGNSQGLRNVAAHEHGHGFGALHVCPINETKLMEPFISFNFFGPQHDDILNIQRHYGDQYEPNDSSGQATSLGDLRNGSTSINTVSSDDNSDQDWYSFSVTGPKQITATMTPTGGTYDSSAQNCSGQTGSCCSGNIVDTRQFNDLGIEIVDANGSSVLVSANTNGLGVADTAQVNVPSGGTYYVRVFSGTSNNIQQYRLDLTIDDPAFVPPSFAFPGGLPAAIEPGVPTVIDVTLDPGDDTVFPGSEAFFCRFGPGAYTMLPLTNLGAGNYQATLPAAACDDTPEFYFQATAATTGVFTEPANAGSSPYTALVGSVNETLVDSAETDIGWTTAGTATDGFWDRGVPENNGRADPPADADGSGQCWLSDNDPTTVNSDIDNGNITLTSPVFDLSNGGTVSWQFWFNDDPANPIDGDSFDVLVSTDGGSAYSLVRTYTTAQPSWRSDSIEVGVEVAATPTFVIRFRAEDVGATQNIVEAGLDDIRISELTCSDPNPACSEADVTTTGAGLGDPGYGVPDNAVTAADLNYFVNGWVASDTAVADVTTTGAGVGDPGYGVPDGAVTAADLNYFVNVWVVGCP